MTDKTITVTLRMDLDDLAAQFRAAADALTADRYAANEARQRAEASLSVTPSTDATVSQSEPDPLDENDHRDRQDRDGMRLTRVAPHHWHPSSGARCGFSCNGLSLANWNSSYGPLAFAPDAAQDATGGDLSASEGESGAEEGGEAAGPSEALLCHECGHDIDEHFGPNTYSDGCDALGCPCPLRPSDIARHLIAQATS